MAKRSKRSQLPGPDFAQAAVALIAAGTADEVAVWKNNTGASVRMVSAGYVPDTAVTGNTTNHFTLQLRNKQASGGGTVGISDLKAYITGVNMSAFVEDALVMSSTAASLVVADGDTVALNKLTVGAGLALPAGLCAITFEYASQ